MQIIPNMLAIHSGEKTVLLFVLIYVNQRNIFRTFLPPKVSPESEKFNYSWDVIIKMCMSILVFVICVTMGNFLGVYFFSIWTLFLM